MAALSFTGSFTLVTLPRDRGRNEDVLGPDGSRQFRKREP
jgi:hypothetical protein